MVEHYTPATPFYGHVHGKLCFGQGEMGQVMKNEDKVQTAEDVAMAGPSWWRGS